MRTIDKNVFNDNFWWGHEQDVFAKGKDIVYEEYTMKKNGRIMSKPRGNNLYSSRYDEVWKRKRSVKRSRKTSNAELCFQEYSKLKDYAMQRNVQSNFDRVQYTSTLKKAGLLPVKRAVDASAGAYPFEVRKSAVKAATDAAVPQEV